MHIYMPILSCCRIFVVPLPPPPSFPQAGPVHSLFQQDLAAEILVQTGNSVDYSLAIRLLSLQWLSLLHHEIAWLSARSESVLCLNPPVHPPTTDAATRLPSQANPSPSLTPLLLKKEKKKSSSGSPQVTESELQ